jgi:hypothetical protein
VELARTRVEGALRAHPDDPALRALAAPIEASAPRPAPPDARAG